MKVYPCPLCGKTSNRRGAPFDTPQQVVGHIDGARDPKHEGESGEDHLDDIEENQTEMEPGEMEKPPRSMSASNPLERETVRAAVFDGEEMPVMEFLDVVDAHLEAGVENEELRQEQIDDLEDDIEQLRGRVGEIEDAVNRTLGYVQALAQEQGSDQITQDMLEEGYL